MFVEILKQYPGKCIMTKLSLHQVTSKDEPDIANFKDDSPEIVGMLRSQIQPSLDNICFMDMRAEKVLDPEDAQQLQFVVFGGILGDHPPQDRAMDFRARFKHIR